MKLNIGEYKDKVYACWQGKNIGGTIGTPYEGKREYLSVTGFSTEKGVVLPNDDLDIQLVWLSAVERMGINGVNAQSLGECWLSFVAPHWNEYGIGKANMRAGLLPPLSGDYHNDWKNSNGAWIRTEIWACLQPGRPDAAVKFAMDDACVDHGSGEGTFAAAFVAAMQSAAFVLDDIRDCIDVALAKIPEDCRIAKTVRMVLDGYAKGFDVKTVRDAVHEADADLGDGWFEAPANVGFTVIGLLYGEGDFKKSVLAAVNCGDDTDCTAATVGATLGILYGTKGIPSDWSEHIGDEIVTVAINRGDLPRLPQTCTELTERVCALAPETVKCKMHFTHHNGANMPCVSFTEGEKKIDSDVKQKLIDSDYASEIMAYVKENTFCVEFLLAKVYVTVHGGADIKPNEEKRLTITFESNRDVLGSIPYRYSIRWWLPDGFKVRGKNFVCVPGWRASKSAVVTEEFVITAGEEVAAVNEIIGEIRADGRATRGYLPVILMG